LVLRAKGEVMGLWVAVARLVVKRKRKNSGKGVYFG
jgi:hypothetical protein